MTVNSTHQSREAEVHFGERLTPRGHLVRAALTAGPAAWWLLVFLLLPMAALLVMSFFSRGDYGEVQLPLTFPQRNTSLMAYASLAHGRLHGNRALAHG